MTSLEVIEREIENFYHEWHFSNAKRRRVTPSDLTRMLRITQLAQPNVTISVDERASTPYIENLEKIAIPMSYFSPKHSNAKQFLLVMSGVIHEALHAKFSRGVETYNPITAHREFFFDFFNILEDIYIEEKALFARKLLQLKNKLFFPEPPTNLDIWKNEKTPVADFLNSLVRLKNRDFDVYMPPKIDYIIAGFLEIPNALLRAKYALYVWEEDIAPLLEFPESYERIFLQQCKVPLGEQEVAEEILKMTPEEAEKAFDASREFRHGAAVLVDYNVKILPLPTSDKQVVSPNIEYRGLAREMSNVGRRRLRTQRLSRLPVGSPFGGYDSSTGGITILIDASASMKALSKRRKPIYETCFPIAYALAKASKAAGLRVSIYAHTTTGNDDAIIYKVPTPERLLYFPLKIMNENADGFVYEYMARRNMFDDVTVIFSDGEPSAPGYRNYGAEEHTLQALKKVKSKVIICELDVDLEFYTGFTRVKPEKLFDEVLDRI